MNFKAILSGAGSILVLFPATTAPQVKTRVGSDKQNMSKDWAAIGADMRAALK